MSQPVASASTNSPLFAALTDTADQQSNSHQTLRLAMADASAQGVAGNGSDAPPPPPGPGATTSTPFVLIICPGGVKFPVNPLTIPPCKQVLGIESAPSSTLQVIEVKSANAPEHISLVLIGAMLLAVVVGFYLGRAARR